VPHFKNITVEEFADRLAYNCVNNPYSDKNPMGFIPWDGMGSDGGGISTGATAHTHGNMSGFVFQGGAVAAAGLSLAVSDVMTQLQEVAISCFSGILPLSQEDASSAFSPFVGYHDLIPQRVKEEITGRAAKRRCFICHTDTHWECDNAGCESHLTLINGINFDKFPLCGPGTCECPHKG
jgi:hypothetical protein